MHRFLLNTRMNPCNSPLKSAAIVLILEDLRHRNYTVFSKLPSYYVLEPLNIPSVDLILTVSL